MGDIQPCLQIVLFDVDRSFWHDEISTSISFLDICSSLVAFCNSFALLNRENLLCIMSFSNKADILYPRRNMASLDSFYPSISATNIIVEELNRVLTSVNENTSCENMGISTSSSECFPQALAKALCS